MYEALIAACCAIAGLQPPLAQTWSDTSLIRADDDWSGVPGMVAYRGDGLVAAPGADPRDVVADGSGTPVDVSANRTDPAAIGLAAGVAEFELENPVVALRGSATAGAPQLVVALDTRSRAGIAVRLTLRDIDGAADAVQPVAVQYRVGGSGDFANVPGGYVADATAAGGELVTPVRAVLPSAADGRELVEVRVLTTDSPGRDEWVGVDDIDITASTVTVPRACGDLVSRPWPSPQPVPGVPRPGDAQPHAPRRPRRARTEQVTVRFRIGPGGGRLRFQVRGRRGVSRMRFSGRIRGRRLPAGAYSITGIATSPQR